MSAPTETATLELRGFGFAFGDRTVVRALDLELPSRGLFTLLGPVAAGKSSLLRFLAGDLVANPNCQSWGTALYLGAPLGELGRPALAGQRARFLMGSLFDTAKDGLAGRERLSRAEQRAAVLAIFEDLGLSDLAPKLESPVVDLAPFEQRVAAMVRAYASPASVVCIDEPTASLDAKGRSAILGVIARMALSRCVLFVTHNRDDLRVLGGEALLLAGGVLWERAPAEQLLRAASTEAGRQFAETGSCAVPSPDAVAEELDPRVAEPESESIEREIASSRDHAGAPMSRVLAASMRWVTPALVGIPRPGLLRDLDDDLGTLAEQRVTVLVCLEEVNPIAAEDLSRHGMTSVWLPVPDMRSPSIDDMASLCETLREATGRGQRVAVHCKGGLGRTGTALAAHFIWLGATPPEALAAVRRVEPRFVQSADQLEFLRRFAAERRGGGAGDSPLTGAARARPPSS